MLRKSVCCLLGILLVVVLLLNRDLLWVSLHYLYSVYCLLWVKLVR